MNTHYNELILESGADLSPLDLFNTAVLASSDYTIRRTIIDPTDGYLAELWVDAVNTTSGETFGLVGEYNGTDTVKITFCDHIDTGVAIDAQPGVAPSTFSSTSFVAQGKYSQSSRAVLVLDRDFIYIGWNLRIKGTAGSSWQGAIGGIVEKTSTYSGGQFFLVSVKAGESYVNIFYEGEWFGDSVAAAVTNKHGRANALHVEGHYPAPIGAMRYFYSKVSFHVNIIEFETDTALVLLGFLPNGILGTKRYYRGRVNMYATLDEGDFFGVPDIYCEAIDTFLFPIA